MIEDSGMNSSGWANRSKKIDEKVKDKIIARERKHRIREQAEEFAEVVSKFTL